MTIEYGGKLIKNVYHNLYKYNRIRAAQLSPYDNIYYCCTQKTASQWFSSIFRDPEVFAYTGLKPFLYKKIGLNEAQFSEPFPLRTVAVHLYINYATYLTIPKPARHKTFFILRDPRDIVVSWYFSAKYSHRPIEPIPQMRRALNDLDFDDGMKYMIDTWSEFGLFEAQRSWVEMTRGQANTKVFRYEDFASDNNYFLAELFDYLDIRMPEDTFAALCRRYAFSAITDKREQGMEQQRSHYRKGIAGDWKNYFDESLMAYFEARTGNLLETLGYLD